MRAILVATITATTAFQIVKGDMPLPPPSKVTVTSRNGHIRAISDPKAGTRVEDLKQHKILWRLPDWYRSMFVDDDGKHLVTQYDGLNLIPTDYTDDLVLLTFWREGKKVREVRVKDFIPNRRILERTMSHYEWGWIDSIDSQGHLKVKRADGKTFLFDVTTGEKTKT